MRATILALLTLLVLSTVVYADPPFIRTGTTRHGGWDKQTCLANVKGVMESLGFTNLTVDNNVEGPNGEYMAEVGCARRSILIIVAGPDHDEAGDLRNAIRRRLKEMQ